MKIGICENEPAILDWIIEQIGQHESLQDVTLATYTTGEAMEAAEADFDLVILDIELDGDLDGITLAGNLKAKNNAVIIIFMTAHQQYVTPLYHIEASGLLLKPLEERLFHQELALALRQYQHNHYQYSFQSFGETTTVSAEEILYIQKRGQKQLIYSINRTTPYETYGSLKQAEKELSQYHFARCNESVLVNLRYVYGGITGDDHLELRFTREKRQQTLRFSVSRRRKKIVKEAITDYQLARVKYE